jgi:LmbE family N-acetylglucosaminyl deacetylase
MRALFLGAHPDDVEVCAGGTVAKLTEQGWGVDIYSWVYGRGDEAREAAKILGAMWFPYRKGEQRAVVAHLDTVGPWSLIVTPSPQDSHQEHRQVAELGYSLARRNNVELWHMNHAMPGGIAMSPNLNHYVVFDTFHAHQKQLAIEAHESQVEKYGSEWFGSIWTRDKHYGDVVGADFAEGYERVFSVG